MWNAQTHKLICTQFWLRKLVLSYASGEVMVK